jgi:hypothetical protein
MPNHDTADNANPRQISAFIIHPSTFPQASSKPVTTDVLRSAKPGILKQIGRICADSALAWQRTRLADQGFFASDFPSKATRQMRTIVETD